MMARNRKQNQTKLTKSAAMKMDSLLTLNIISIEGGGSKKFRRKTLNTALGTLFYRYYSFYTLFYGFMEWFLWAHAK